MKIGSWIAVVVCLVVSLASSTLAQQNTGSPKQTGSGKQQIPILGFAQDNEVTDFITTIESDFFLEGFNEVPDRRLARAISIFIGPDLVLNGAFVPPSEFYMSPSQLEIMSGKTFPNEGCRVERLIFSETGDYVVLLVDASTQASFEYHQNCILSAALTSLGEPLDGTPTLSSSELYQRLQGVVEGLR